MAAPGQRLPHCVVALLPLLALARAMGLAPYSLQPHLRVERSRAAMVLSGAIFCFHLFVFVYAGYSQSHLTSDYFGNGVVSVVMPIADHFVGMGVPTYTFATAVLTATEEKCERLLVLLKCVENALGPDALNLPRLARRSWTLTGQMFLIAFSVAIMMIWKYMEVTTSLPMSLHWFWLFLLICLPMQIFFAFTIVIKEFFEILNEHCWVLVEILQENSVGCTMKFSIQYSGEKSGHLREQSRIPEYDADFLKIADKIRKLRIVHRKLQETCAAIDGIFGHMWLAQYTYFLIMITCSAYVQILAVHGEGSFFKASVMVMPAAVNGFLGALGAWAAGAAVSAGTAAGRGGGAAVALLLATDGRAAAQRQAQLFLAQLRAQPVRFCAGGLFPLDLRFFVGLLGTILGYVVIVVQFALQDAAAPAGPCQYNLSQALALNCSDDACSGCRVQFSVR